MILENLKDHPHFRRLVSREFQNSWLTRADSLDTPESIFQIGVQKLLHARKCDTLDPDDFLLNTDLSEVLGNSGGALRDEHMLERCTLDPLRNLCKRGRQPPGEAGGPI